MNMNTFDDQITTRLGKRKQTDLAFILVLSTVAISSFGTNPKVETLRFETQNANRYMNPLFAKVEVKENIPFRTVTNNKGASEELRLDVYRPSGDKETARPAILWIHGGGFRPGNDKKQKYIVVMATEFARRGYVSVAPDYRVRENPKADFQGTLRDAVEDCRAALQWMKSESNTLGMDPLRMAVGGGSAGGMTAVSLVALENNRAARSGDPGIFALVNLWGSPVLSSLLSEIDRRFPPTVIVHGKLDKTVPFEQSVQLAARLKEVGIPCHLFAIPDAAHTPSEHLPAIVETCAKFLHEILVKKSSRLMP